MTPLRFFLASLAVLLLPAGLRATGQEADVIYIDGQRWQLLGKPIEHDSTLCLRFYKFLPKGRSHSSANWGGYTAYWSIAGDCLQLDSVEIEEVGSKTRLFLHPKQMRKPFAGYYRKGESIAATWLDHPIRAGRGRTVYYEHLGFFRNLEEECIISLSRGRVTGKRFRHNSKVKGMTLHDVQRKLQEEFPFERFPEFRGMQMFFRITDMRISKFGEFLGCTPIVWFRETGKKAEKSRSGIQDAEHPLLKTFAEALKAIYPWETVLIDGKPMSYRGSRVIILVAPD